MRSFRYVTRLPSPRRRPRRLFLDPCWHIPGFLTDAQATLAAAVEEGIISAAKVASPEIQAEGVPKVDSWSMSTGLFGPTACSVPAGHKMYWSNNCSCSSH